MANVVVDDIMIPEAVAIIGWRNIKLRAVEETEGNVLLWKAQLRLMGDQNRNEITVKQEARRGGGTGSKEAAEGREAGTSGNGKGNGGSPPVDAYTPVKQMAAVALFCTKRA